MVSGRARTTPAPVDADADVPAAEDLGQPAEARRELGDHLPAVVAALKATPRSGMRRWSCVVNRRHASRAVIPTHRCRG